MEQRNGQQAIGRIDRFNIQYCTNPGSTAINGSQSYSTT